MEAHCVDCDEILDVELMDEYRMVINDQNAEIIHQFKNCSHFYVEISVKYRNNDINILAEVYVFFLHFYFTLYENLSIL